MDKKLTYQILKYFDETMPGERGQLIPEDFNSTEEETDEIIRSLDSKDLIDNVFYADDRPYETSGVVVTHLGKKYLEENSIYGNVKKLRDEVKGWFS